jgi:nucleotide-binding universal stress UspA family protein
MSKRPARRSTTVPSFNLRHVLLADDGSKGCAPARGFALMLAATTKARLTALYVRDPLESEEDGLRKLAPTLKAAAAAGIDCEPLIERPVGISSPGRRIISAAKTQRADAIVLGARGAGLARLLGSVSNYVVKHADGSVCVVR